jgi:hypothetical protein
VPISNTEDYRMSIELLTEPESIRDACCEILTAPEPAHVAVAFWGRGAIEELGVHHSAAGTRLIVNAESGCCHPQELRELLAIENIKVRTLSRLHAKTYIGKSRMVVGSANASSNGLGFQGSELSGWREACTVIDVAEPVMAARQWFEARWSEGTDLSERIIKKAEAAWATARRRAHGLANSTASKVEAETAMSLDGAPIYVDVTDENPDISDREFQQGLRQNGLTRSGDIDFYQDWASMPKDALLLTFGVEKDGTEPFVDGEWLTGFSVRYLKMKDGKRAYPVIRATAADRKDFGCPITAKSLTSAVRRVIETLNSRGASRDFRAAMGAQYTRKTAWCVPLHAFVEYCRARGIELPSALIRGWQQRSARSASADWKPRTSGAA